MADDKFNPNEDAISEDKFDLVDIVEASMTPNHDRLLIRKIDGIDLTYLNLCVTDLRQRTSTKNAAGTTCNWVLDPRCGDEGPSAGGRVQLGVWRGVSVRGYIKSGGTSLIQTLAFGLVRSKDDAWPLPELVRTDDRLIRPHAVQNSPTQTQREVRYRGFDPSYVDAAKATIAISAGVIDVRSVKMQDGSYNIHVLTESPTWATFVVTAPDTTSFRNKGTPFEEMVEVWNSIANNDLATGLYTSPSVGYRITDVSISDQLDGSVQITRVQVAKKAFVAATPDNFWYENKTREREVLHEEWFGIAEDDTFTGLWTDPDGYSILQCQKSEGQNGVVSVDRVSVLKNTWFSAVLNAGDDDKIGTNAFVYTREGVTAGFKSMSYISQHIPIADAEGIVKALMDGTGITAWDDGGAFAAGDIRSNGGLCYIRRSAAETSEATFVEDVALGVWDRISSASYSNSDGNVCTVSFETEPALEYGYLESQTPQTGKVPASSVYVWKNVDPARVDTVWAKAVAYAGGLTHKTANKAFDNRGIATITAEAWTPLESANGSTWTGNTSTVIQHDIVRKPSGTNDMDRWCYRSFRYVITYKYTEHQAYTDIAGGGAPSNPGGLEGSSVKEVAYHVWRAVNVNKIVFSEWGDGPVNTKTIPPPTTAEFGAA